MGNGIDGSCSSGICDRSGDMSGSCGGSHVLMTLVVQDSNGSGGGGAVVAVVGVVIVEIVY